MSLRTMYESLRRTYVGRKVEEAVTRKSQVTIDKEKEKRKEE